jgi:hypothetical protein
MAPSPNFVQCVKQVFALSVRHTSPWYRSLGAGTGPP